MSFLPSSDAQPPVARLPRRGSSFSARRLPRAVEAHRYLTCTVAAVTLAVALRAPWFGAPLGNDEGGLTYIAAHWHTGGPNLYGFYFIDRPPLLLGVFRVAAETGGATAVRTIGAVTAALLVVVVSLIARELGGHRPGIWAAFISAVLVSSPSLGSVMTPAELIACLPSALSVLLLLIGLRRPQSSLLCFAAAGSLAIGALLVKQSFGDALVAGFVCVTALAILERDGRRWAALGGAYLGGVLLALGGLELWEAVSGLRDGTTAYALVGFRIDGLHALGGSAGGLLGRFVDRLLHPLVISGLALALLLGTVGFRRLRDRRVIQATLGAWALAGLAGVLLGGSYWPHYLIELAPVAAVTAAFALAGAGRWGARLTAVALAILALAGAAVGSGFDQGSAVEAKAIGEYVRDRSEPGDTIYVRYAKANINFYSGLRNPYPYEWSLMLRTLGDAQPRLRALLRSNDRPTWVAAWEPSDAYGLDAGGVTASLMRRHYRVVGQVCGTPVLLERGLSRPGPRTSTRACD